MLLMVVSMFAVQALASAATPENNQVKRASYFIRYPSFSISRWLLESLRATAALRAAIGSVHGAHGALQRTRTRFRQVRAIVGAKFLARNFDPKTRVARRSAGQRLPRTSTH
jgi:hypothetical protein